MSAVSPLTLAELLAPSADADGQGSAPGDRAAGGAPVPAGLASSRIGDVCLDSRLVEPGALYLAVGGGSTHGLLHAAEALARGAVAVALDPADLVRGADRSGDAARLVRVTEAHAALRAAGAPLVEVGDLAARAPLLAARLHAHPDRALTLVAVTGTDGKTSVCRFVAAALEALGTPCGYVGTLGWGRGDALERTALTTPDAVSLQGILARLRDGGARAVALEASSHALATGRLDALALDVAVLTNLGRDHLDYHGDVASYARAKARLFDFPTLAAVVLNGDDDFGRELATARERAGAPSTRVLYSVEEATASAGGEREPATPDAPAPHVVRAVARDVTASARGLAFTLVDGAHRARVESPLSGRFNVANLLACHGVLRALGHAPEAAAATLGRLRPVAGRMERFVAASRPTVLVDFAHTPQALAAAIDAAREHCTGALWVVFGCGGDRDRGKRAPMGRAAEAADHVVVTDDNPRTERSADIIAEVLEGMRERERATVIPDRRAAIAHAVRAAADGDVVLVAGKGHEDYQIVGDTRLAFSDRVCVGELLAEAARC